MVEPITVMIIGCIISAIGIALAATSTVITVYFNLKMQKMSASQQRKYKKAKEKITNKYTYSTTPDEYIKLACLLHLAKEEAKQCSHLSINTDTGNVTLMVSLQNIELKYKPYKTWYSCKFHYDENDKSIWTTFLDTKSRDRLQSHLNNDLKINDLFEKCKVLNQNVDEDISESASENDSEEVQKKRSNDNVRRRRTDVKKWNWPDDEIANTNVGESTTPSRTSHTPRRLVDPFKEMEIPLVDNEQETKEFFW